MEYTVFTPYKGLLGGFLIGLSAVLLLWFNGRMAGISGMIHQVCPPKDKIELWRILFLLGLFVGGLFFIYFLTYNFLYVHIIQY